MSETATIPGKYYDQHLLAYLHAVEKWRRLTELKCIQKIQNLTGQNAHRWKRRAEVKWYNLGDENMLCLAEHRHRETKINCLQQDGEDLLSDSTKLKLATVFYAELFSKERQLDPNLDPDTI
jgi:hypothetical protein